MAYVNPTPADVKADFPTFANVDDTAIQRRIDRAAMWVDESWLESDYTYAKELLAAHYLTIDGLGGGDAEIAAYREAGVVKLKSGTLDVTFSEIAASGGSEFDETSFGRRFYALLRKNKSGPLTTGGGCDGIAGAATDVPWAWATNGWGL